MIADWKPIATAPLDREIMVRDRDGYTAVVRGYKVAPYGTDPEPDKRAPRWLIANSDYSTFYGATHWDDLPENNP